MQEVTLFRDGRRFDLLDDDRRHHLRAELEHLKHAPRRQLGTGQPARKTHEVFDLRRAAGLTAGSQPVEHNCRDTFGSGINSRSHSGRSGANNRQIDRSRRTIPPHAGARRQFAKTGID